MNKAEIIDALEESRRTIFEALESIGDDRLVEPGAVDQWSVKDLIFHLTMWEAEMVKLLWQASQGETPTTVHMTDVPVDEINETWSVEGKNRDLEKVWEDYRGVRKQTLRRLSGFSDNDLEDVERFSWLNGTPLWKWIGEDSFLHEQEHAEQIKLWRAERGI